MYKMIALHGETLRGTLRVDVLAGMMRAALFIRGRVEAELTVYIVDESGRIHGAVLDKTMTANIDGVFGVRAAFITSREAHSVRFLLSGGRIRSKAEAERIKQNIRVHESAVHASKVSAGAVKGSMPNSGGDRIKNRDEGSDSDEARSEALKNILKKAEELFSPIDETKSHLKENAVFNPFPEAFPRSNWRRVTYPGTNRYYLEGEALKDGMRLVIHALPGEYSPVNPMRNSGFKKFMRANDGSGYWLKIRRRS